MLEHEFLAILKIKAIEKFNLPGSDQWRQRDYDYISDLIFNKTGVRLSLSTLKRIWKDDELKTPQTYTLNALANWLGYESWSEFKSAHIQSNPASSTEELARKRKPTIKFKSIYYLAIPVLLFIVYVLTRFTLPESVTLPPEGVVFKSKKTSEDGVPNTVVFEYDISKMDVDSAFIQHSWDQRLKARVTRDQHFQTFIYYYPGYHTSHLVVNNKIVQSDTVNINTRGWVALAESNTYNEPPIYFKTSDFIQNRQLYLPPKTLQDYGAMTKDHTASVNYFNVGEFNATDGEHFTIETRIKNSLDEGAMVCQHTQVSIICEYGRISVPFCHPGCVSNIHLHIGEVFRDGKQNDLSAFGIDLSLWNEIKIEVRNKKVEITVNGKSIYSLGFTDALGQVVGFHYRFEGSGAVDWIKLYNSEQVLTYWDEF